ncbi:uncharacterized protein LOC143365252 [Halictus rubicundus]|uniref:uncharacterized protein LOC143365252 n=1 Tax=Halictus rubicundus TaxID=77578 RepID=UPI004035A57F
MSCFIFGWQSYLSPSSRVFAKPIQYNEVILNSWKLCTYMIKVNTNYTNHTNVFCTMVEFKDGMKACAGNPGSPVVCENQYHEIAILGIASWSNFSLECGDLPTYLDLGIFRVWIYDLLLDNKTENLQDNSGKLNNFKSNKSIISWKDKTHVETNYTSENTKIHLQNLSVVASVYQEISTESINMTQFWNKLYTPMNIQRDTSDTSFVTHNYHYYHHHANYTNILKESNNNIYKYEEIDKGISFQDQITESTQKDELTNLNKSLLCSKRFNTITVEPNNHTTEFNSFEFLVPFNIENVVTSCSNIATTCKNIYFLIYILVLFRQITLCIVFILYITRNT